LRAWSRYGYPRLTSKSFCRARPGFGRFLFAILRRRGGFQRMQEPRRDGSHFLDCGRKRRLVGFRRLVETSNLSDKLQRGRPHLIVGHRRIEVEKSFDVPAHREIDLGAKSQLPAMRAHPIFAQEGSAAKSRPASLCFLRPLRRFSAPSAVRNTPLNVAELSRNRSRPAANCAVAPSPVGLQAVPCGGMIRLYRAPMLRRAVSPGSHK
jgi:hypothetical protein